MQLNNIFIHFLCIMLVNAVAINKYTEDLNTTIKFVNDPDNVFRDVYAECFLHLSYICLQKKTLLYIKELNNLSEVSVVGDFVKFVKVNTTDKAEDGNRQEDNPSNTSEQLELMIDKAINSFFNNHVLKFSALGSDVSMFNNVEKFVGRKKRKGGGGGDGDHGDHDGGKKKMMMMAMMCMKMKLMIMIPAMMGMMGMMSFKGMIFSMLSFMVSKMILLMKILEKKGSGAGFGGIAGGGNDGVWAASSGGGGAWMPAGSQDFGAGGYDANAQWQSRSNFEMDYENKPVISYFTPVGKYNNALNKNNVYASKKLNEAVKNKIINTPKSRKKRDLIDIVHKTYTYWINKLFGTSNKRRSTVNIIPKYKIVNGVKYVFHPFHKLQKVNTLKDVQGTKIKTADDGFKPIITADDYNRGEIFEGGVQSRMNRKKFYKMKDAVNDTVDDNPWE